jgi:hypothetical protein
VEAIMSNPKPGTQEWLDAIAEHDAEQERSGNANQTWSTGGAEENAQRGDSAK